MDNLVSSTEDKLPAELRAVLQIFRYDRELQVKVLPHVDFARQSINWNRIWENDFSGGYAAAIIWAQAIWCDQIQTQSDPFDRALAMVPGLRQAVLRALAIRWGFKI